MVERKQQLFGFFERIVRIGLRFLHAHHHEIVFMSTRMQFILFRNVYGQTIASRSPNCVSRHGKGTELKGLRGGQVRISIARYFVKISIYSLHLQYIFLPVRARFPLGWCQYMETSKKKNLRLKDSIFVKFVKLH